MMKIALISLMVTLPFVGSSQLISFMKAYGNSGYDFGRDIKQDTDTGYVVTGSSSSFVSEQADVYLLKVDSLGNFKWSMNYGGPDSDWGQSIVVTNDSTYAIGGYTNSFGAGGFDFYLLRIAADGSLLWQNTYGGSDWDRAYGLVQTADSGFVMAGESYSFNNGNLSAYVVRTDKNGDTLWTYVESSTSESYFRDVAIDGDSIILAGGYYSSANSSIDGFIKTMHVNGTEGSMKTIGQGYDEYFTSVYAGTGHYNFGGARAYNFDTEKTNMWNYKMQNDWTEVFDLVYVNNSPEYDQVNDIVTRWYNEDTYFIGESESWGYQLDGEEDIFMGKCSSGGIYFAANNYGEKGEDKGQALDNCYDNGVVFLADTKFFSSGGNNIIIMKLNYTWTYPDQFNDISYEDITTTIHEELNETVVYPNPFEKSINFGQYLTGTITVYDLSGKEVYSQAISSDQLDLSHLEAGTYLLSYYNAMNESYSQAQIVKR